MNKKGQVYILVAIVLCVALFGIVSVVNRVEQDPMIDDFEEISLNYRIESEKFLNSVLNSDEDVFTNFSLFTYQFTGYTKSKNPGYGLIYAFKLGNDLQVGNYLDRVINVSDDVVLGCYDRIPAALSFEGISIPSGEHVIGDVTGCILDLTISSADKELSIEIDGVKYLFEIESGVPEIMIVGRLDKDEQRKVFIKGDIKNV